MKILDIPGLAAIPGGVNASGNTQIQGTRFRINPLSTSGGSQAGFVAFQDGSIDARCFFGASGGYVASTTANWDIANLGKEPEQVDSIITYGLRMAGSSASGSQNDADNNMHLVWLRFTNDVMVAIRHAHVIKPFIGNSSYWELVIDRANKLCRIYRDDALFLEYDLSSYLTEGSEFVGIAFGVRLTGSFHPRYDVNFRDMYVAEFTPDDGHIRLGPQRVIPLPVSNVLADTWDKSHPTTPAADLISDRHTAHGQLTPTTYVVANANDPQGIVEFDYSQVPADAVLNGLSFRVTAAGDSGSSYLESKVLDGDTEVVGVVEQFGQQYDRTSADMAMSGLCNGPGAVDAPVIDIGNVSSVSGYRLKLRAVPSP